MTKALDTHAKEVEQKQARVNDLKKTIKDNEAKLITLETNYRNAVVENKKDVDELFHNIEALQGSLRADKHKLKTLQSVTDEHLKKHAIDTLNSFKIDVTNDYKSKADRVDEKIKQAKQVYIKSVLLLDDELDVINNDFKGAARQYASVMNQHDVTKDDIDSSLYSELDNAKHGVIKEVQTEPRTIQITEFKGVS